MRTVTISKTVRTYQEMVEAAKNGEVGQSALEKAKEWLREGMTMHDWYDYVFENWKTALEQIGFMEPKIQFSGFWSQGDGASFTCRYVDCEKLLEFLGTERKRNKVISMDGDSRLWILEAIGWDMEHDEHYQWLSLVATNYLNGEVVRVSHYYSHYNTCNFRVEDTARSLMPDSPVYEEIDRFQADGEELREAICKAIYRHLEEEYNYLISEESIADFAAANEYEFDENGNPY